MRYHDIDWPEGWLPADEHVAAILGPYVFYPVGDMPAGEEFRVRNRSGFRVRTPMLREIPGEFAADDWIAEYLLPHTTYHIAASKDPLNACAQCLLFDTTCLGD